MEYVLNFLTHRQAVVAYGGARASAYHPTRGEPQGSALSVILFLVYMEDMPEGIDWQAYMEDVLVFITGTTSRKSRVTCPGWLTS